MRTVLFTALVALAMSGAAHAAKDASSAIKVDTTWNVSLDADGHVVDLKQSTQVKPLLSEPLARAIRSWVFEPGRVDGRPAATETTLQVGVTLEPNASNGYVVRVDHVNTGGGIAKTLAPTFPVSVLRRESDTFSALAVVQVHYDAAGKVIGAEVAPGAPEVDRAVSDAALKSVRHWTFQPERVGGHALASSAYVPICFTLTRDRRAPAADCASWTPPGASTTVANGGSLALEPAATLKSDVIGRTL